MGVTGITNTHMTNIANGGPAEAGDNYLGGISDNTTVAGGRVSLCNAPPGSGGSGGAGWPAVAMDGEYYGA